MNNQNMYQASDGKWYPVSDMPQGYQGGGGHGGGYGGGYGQQPQMQYGQQPVYVQQQRPGGGVGAGAAGGLGCCAACCAALLCFDLGACLF